MKRDVVSGSVLSVAVIVAGLFGGQGKAEAEQALLKKGTPVKLVFQSHLSSKTARIGDHVTFRVDEPVEVDGKTVIAAGTKEEALVERISKRGRYGINARIRLHMMPIRSVAGGKVPIGFKDEGPIVSGKTGGAAAATVGGAALLGPIGLIGGLFIPGKTVDAKPGDKMTVEVAADKSLQIKQR